MRGEKYFISIYIIYTIDVKYVSSIIFLIAETLLFDAVSLFKQSNTNYLGMQSSLAYTGKNLAGSYKIHT